MLRGVRSRRSNSSTRPTPLASGALYLGLDIGDREILLASLDRGHGAQVDDERPELDDLQAFGRRLRLVCASPTAVIECTVQM